MTEDRRQKTDDRKQKTDDRLQMKSLPRKRTRKITEKPKKLIIGYRILTIF